MKKISYSLRIGIIGNKEYLNEIFFDNLKSSAIKFNLSDDNYEVLIVFKQIPIKIKIYTYEKIDNLIYDFDNVKKIDAIILTLDLYEPDSLKIINKLSVDEFNQSFAFQGLSILVGLNIEQILNKPTSKKFKISRFQLEKITKDLNFIYCFEIFNKNRDVNEIYNTIFNDFILRFQYSNPDLFETAKEYGKSLLS
ncbi:MAG: hypothetical protein ACFFC3_16710 [Candidatus Odinarchaeota archaeon]